MTDDKSLTDKERKNLGQHRGYRGGRTIQIFVLIQISLHTKYQFTTLYEIFLFLSRKCWVVPKRHSLR